MASGPASENCPAIPPAEQWATGFQPRPLGRNHIPWPVQDGKPPDFVRLRSDSGLAIAANEGLVEDVRGLRIAVLEPRAGDAEQARSFVGVVRMSFAASQASEAAW